MSFGVFFKMGGNRTANILLLLVVDLSYKPTNTAPMKNKTHS